MLLVGSASLADVNTAVEASIMNILLSTPLANITENKDLCVAHQCKSDISVYKQICRNKKR